MQPKKRTVLFPLPLVATGASSVYPCKRMRAWCPPAVRTSPRSLVHDDTSAATEEVHAVGNKPKTVVLLLRAFRGIVSRQNSGRRFQATAFSTERNCALNFIHRPVTNRPRATPRLPIGSACFALAALLVAPSLLMAETILPPILSATFDRATISPGGYAYLTFTITNPNSVNLTGIGFSDDLSPLNMSVFSSVPGGCSGHSASRTTRSGTAGSSIITISEPTFAPYETCTYTFIVVNTVDTALGAQITITSAIISANGGTGSPALAPITVVANAAPQLTATFDDSWIPLFGTTYLNFKPINPNNGTLTGVAFTDTVPAGLSIIATGTSCSPGPVIIGADSFDVSAEPGSNLISFSNGILYPGTQCTWRVQVEGFRLGLQMNTTSTITSTNAGSGDAASASVAVGEEIFTNGFEQN